VRSDFAFPALAHAEAGVDTDSRYGPIDDQHELGLGWHLIEEIRRWTNLPLVLKGILSPLDAVRAADLGVDGIVVSTHGGRQLDRVIATPDALPPIVAAVGGRTEIWVDGGIRSGLDVLTAFALGATGTLVGRPLYWALAVGGAAGIARAVAILRDEIATGLALLGVERPDGLGHSYLAP
jgi:4-hydroxymandelate oxidase